MNDEMLMIIQLNKDTCKTQGRIYEQAAYDGCDIKKFSDKYLSSRFCKNRIETPYSSFQMEDAQTCLEFIYPEIQISPNPGSETIFDPDIAYWIGYTYHQLYCETGIYGYKLRKLVPFEKLLLNYPAHHTLDEFYSIEKLCSYYNLKINHLYKEFVLYLDNAG